jgi:hypothetical protein
MIFRIFGGAAKGMWEGSQRYLRDTNLDVGHEGFCAARVLAQDRSPEHL